MNETLRSAAVLSLAAVTSAVVQSHVSALPTTTTMENTGFAVAMVVLFGAAITSLMRGFREEEAKVRVKA
jgi:hypothetical protein